MPESLHDAVAAVAAEGAKSNTQIVDSWVKDGTPAAEPVTTETPTVPAATEQPRDDQGRFAPKSDAAPAAVPAGANASPANAVAGEEQPAAPTAQEFIDALLGDKDEAFKIPKGVRVPLKRGNEIEHVPLETLMTGGMMERDYRIKTAETARQRREYEQGQSQVAAERARLQAREAFVKEQEQLFADAQKDPEKWAAFQAHLDQLQSNPFYRKNFEDALAKRETDAELAVYREREEQELIHDGVSQAVEWIERMSKEPDFQNVDAERVRVRYGELLSSGRARLDPSEVQQLFRQEADYLKSRVTPVQSELEALRAEIQALKSGKAAEAHNATTAHALARAKTPPVAQGQPPAPAGSRPKGQFGPRDLADRNAEWARQR